MRVIKFLTRFLIAAVFMLTLTYYNNSVHADSGESSEEILDEIIEIRAQDGEITDSQVEPIRQALLNIDPLYLELLAEHDVVVLISDISTTNLEEYKITEGTSVRIDDHSMDGRHYDDIPGVYFQKNEELGMDPTAYVSVRPEASEPAETALHEVGHAVDFILSGELSQTTGSFPFSTTDDTFENIVEEERMNLFPDDSGRYSLVNEMIETGEMDSAGEGEGYHDEPAEFFASAFEFYFDDEASKDFLKTNGPRTFNVFETLPSRFIDMTEYDDEGLKVEWTPNDRADSYEVYVLGLSGEGPVETLPGDASEFTFSHEDNDLDGEHGTLSYVSLEIYLEALDEDGNLLYKTNVVSDADQEVDIADLEEKIAEAEALQEEVNDDMGYLEYELEAAYDVLERYNAGESAEFPARQSDVYNQINSLEEMMEMFEEDDTAGHDADRTIALNEDESGEESSDSDSDIETADEPSTDEAGDTATPSHGTSGNVVLIMALIIFIGILIAIGIFGIYIFKKKKQNK